MAVASRSFVISGNEPRGDGIHRDATTRQFFGGAARQTDHASFGGCVICLAGITHQAHYRGDVDDAATFLLQHWPSNGSAAQKDSGEV